MLLPPASTRRRLFAGSVVAALVGITGMSAASADLQVDEGTTRIVSGTQVPQGEAPYMAHLYVTLPSKSWTCGGAVISPTAILTAAHCLRDGVGNGGTATKVTASIGHSRWKDAEAAGNVRVSTSWKMGAGPGRGDWAVLKLDKPITVAKMPKLSTGAQDTGPDFVVQGWGNTAEGGQASELLLKVGLRFVPNSQCPLYTETELCAGTPDGSPKSSCNGDSGGPLMLGDTIVGIVSWQIGCGRKGEPGHYAKVSKYLSQINQATRQFETS